MRLRMSGESVRVGVGVAESGLAHGAVYELCCSSAESYSPLMI